MAFIAKIKVKNTVPFIVAFRSGKKSISTPENLGVM
jgi:hypothetical protein